MLTRCNETALRLPQTSEMQLGRPVWVSAGSRRLPEDGREARPLFKLAANYRVTFARKLVVSSPAP
jgi:hypothetical protein